MNKLEKALNEINLIDNLSLKNTIIHKLNPVSKLAVTIIYIVMVTSCYRYSISALLPWFIYPIVILILSELPVIQTLKRLLIIVPVILFIGIGNIFFNNNLKCNIFKCIWIYNNIFSSYKNEICSNI